MQIGKLRHRLQLQEATETQDTYGAVTSAWATITTVWGSIEPLRGNEALLAQEVHGSMVHRILIRAYTDLTVKWRIYDGKRYFYINEIRNFQERDIYQELICTEKQPA